ncbi:PepSY domain-containing protein [Acetobacter sicerae]|uniref:PepSY domain-containing protein n=1 Tax=Acetobacter sicerae TaxID=85325 RepID=A0ABS8VWJ1_9PROT|nr:PepSY-associated TM helix domain-containing protein [Acetobacter sicerae]MCE0743683.1 PepSY domain-containing protein [Acetobacter sicerae]
MKLREDIVAVYREVHSWVGILAALFLFVAFYAGAVSMFEQTLQNWLTPESHLPAPVSLDRTPELMEKAFAAFPDARRNYTIVLAPDKTQPARLIWPQNPKSHEHGPTPLVAAALDTNGILITEKQPPSETAHFIDVLHQRVGLPLPEDVAMPFMGVVALAYAVALVSGVIAFLPALKRTLFAVRLEGGKRRAWLDLHNVFGFFSLPFHVVMAITSVLFAFHEPIYAVQNMLFHNETHPAHARPHPAPARDAVSLMTPAALVASLAQQAPGFEPDTLNYTTRPGPGGGTLTLRVAGHDPRFVMRGPNAGFAVMDPASGRILSTDYLPGHQSSGFATITSFFSLHFGSYGGYPVRWAYLVLGFGGAFLFYTGNQLWIMARQRRERATGLVSETRGSRILSSLTIGCTTGCMTGIAAIITFAAIVHTPMAYTPVALIYYTTFLLCTLLAFILSTQRKAQVLFCLAALSHIALAMAALTRGLSLGDDTSFIVAALAFILALLFFMVAKKRGHSALTSLKKAL